VNAVNAQNLTLPSGLAKIGDTQYTVGTNAMPTTIADLNNIPIKYVNGQTVFIRDVGQVHDGWAVQQNIVRTDGRRSVLLSVIKNGNASTVAVVNGVRKVLEIARASAPPGLSINELFDQSKLVTASITGVLREGGIAAGLTGLMILLFLGSWRSTLIVLISIPLSILTSIVVLYFLGDTLNTMTLGGMALAVGILVDDSAATIENTHRLQRRDESRGGDFARLRRHCGADHGVNACDQLRVHLGDLPRRAGKIPVHPARARRRLRHARVLRSVADFNAGCHRPLAQGRAPRRGL
jgi:multidrug efflux pump subunit AcrB